ncbi:hypothetical protein ACJX0J_029881, partial [Zea mays]
MSCRQKVSIILCASSSLRLLLTFTSENVNCKEMVCSQLVLSGDSITEQPFARWLRFIDYVFSGLFNFGCNASDNSCISPLVQLPLYLHLVGKLQPHCNKVYKRFAMRENKFMAVCIETVLCIELRKNSQ